MLVSAEAITLVLCALLTFVNGHFVQRNDGQRQHQLREARRRFPEQLHRRTPELLHRRGAPNVEAMVSQIRKESRASDKAILDGLLEYFDLQRDLYLAMRKRFELMYRSITGHSPVLPGQTIQATSATTAPATTPPTVATPPVYQCVKSNQPNAFPSSAPYHGSANGLQFSAYCDMESGGGGWTVFQRRKNGSVSFDRDWNGYATGFGSPEGEFWLGNEKIHQITKQGRHEMRIDLRTENGRRYTAHFTNFRIGPNSDGYRLHVDGFQSASLDPSFTRGAHSNFIANEMKFSTPDVDNDHSTTGSCAGRYHCGWWFNSCFNVNLNGVYDGRLQGNWQGIVWSHDNTNVTKPIFTEMKMRPRI